MDVKWEIKLYCLNWFFWQYLDSSQLQQAITMMLKQNKLNGKCLLEWLGKIFFGLWRLQMFCVIYDLSLSASALTSCTPLCACDTWGMEFNAGLNSVQSQWSASRGMLQRAAVQQQVAQQFDRLPPLRTFLPKILIFLFLIANKTNSKLH